MASNVHDSVIHVILRTKGQESIDGLRKSTENYKGLLADLTAQFARGDVSAEEFSARQAKLSREYEKQATLLRQLEDAQAGAAASAGKLDAAQGKAAKSGLNLGQTLLNSGRFVQDFAQGGIGGVLNNIEGLTVALGLGSGLAGVLTIVGVAFALLKPTIAEFFNSLSAPKVQGFANSVEGLQKQLGGARDRMKELGEAGNLTGKGLREYNTLRERTAEIEKRIADQEERQKNLKANQARKEPGQDDAERERAKALQGALTRDDQRSIEAGIQEVIAGGEKKDLFQRQGILRGQIPNARDPGVRADLERQLREVREKLRDFGSVDNMKRRAEQAQSVVAQSVQGGKLPETQFIERLMGLSPDAFPESARQNFARGTPSGIVQGRVGKNVLPKLKEGFGKAVDEAKKESAKREKEKRQKGTQAFFDDSEKEEAAEAKGEAASGRNEGRQRRQRGQDRNKLEKGLGDDFIAQAQVRRLGIENDPTLSGDERAAARERFGRDFRRQATNKLRAGGMDAGDAAGLVTRNQGFLDADIARQLALMESQTGRADPAALQGALQQALAGRPGPAARRPPGARPPRRGMFGRPPGLPSVGVSGPSPAAPLAAAGQQGLANQGRLVSGVGQLAAVGERLMNGQEMQAVQIQALSRAIVGLNARSRSLLRNGR